MKINVKYLIAFFALLIIELIIGFFINDAYIRPYIGDVLVVILMYTFIRGIVKKQIKFLPVYLFLFAAIVEFAQYYRLVYLLNLQDNKVISTIIGTSFDLKDILCYLISTIMLIKWERVEKYTD
ncbi:MAG: DUF2809 domain-containing protein [Clostridiaceae bacterium]|nr:DUF2809 domain-containing protein [Clostridiaceae bacterium]